MDQKVGFATHFSAEERNRKATEINLWDPVGVILHVEWIKSLKVLLGEVESSVFPHELIFRLCWWSSLFRPWDSRNDGIKLWTRTHETSPKKSLNTFFQQVKVQIIMVISLRAKCLFGCFCLFVVGPRSFSERKPFSIEQRTNQSMNQSIKQSMINQPSNHPTNRPTNQFINQPTNQSLKSTSGTLRRHLA